MPSRTDALAPARSRPPRSKLIATIAATTVILLGAGLIGGGVSASAATSIEGVWSFNGGKVAIQPRSGGTFVGTVVATTKFAQCPHPIGEEMWTGISPQPDGSYWGLHQWYFESCVPNPTLGPTAWRVLEAKSGSHFLRVCFSSPGGPQPTIATDGTSANVTYGCVDSALIAALPSAASTRRVRHLVLPSNRKCYSHRVFQIHLRDPKNDPLKEVVITLGKRKITVARHAGTIVATINLRGLPKGAFTVKIRAVTVLGHRLSASRTYHTCVSKRKPGKSKKA